MTYGNYHYQANRFARAQLSRHADKRAQQRCIDQNSVRLVLAYGEREFDGRGGLRYLMTEKAVALLRRAVGKTPQVEALAGVYVVVSTEDPTVITLGHRFA